MTSLENVGTLCEWMTSCGFHMHTSVHSFGSAADKCRIEEFNI